MAPNDRFNYGDLLFSYVIKFYFGDMFDEIIDVSTIKSDLSDKGGFPTKKYDILYCADNSTDNYFIAAGGDCLGVEWDVILSYVDAKIAKMYSIRRYIRRLHITCIGRKLLDMFMSPIIKLYIRFVYPHKTTYVFTPGKNELPAFSRIFYNSLSCSAFNQKDNPIEKNKESSLIFQNVDYIAVRDEITQKGLQRIGIKSNLVADSAILMCYVFKDKLINYSSITKEYGLKEKEFIFFQVNENLYRTHKNTIIQVIKNVIRNYNIKICLCPIGTAWGHGDQNALRNIKKEICSENVILIKDVNIWIIMSLIKNSALYVGSSLHGAITSMSFDVPLVGFGPSKLSDYLRTWTNCPNEVFASISGLELTIYNQLNNKLVVNKTNQINSVLDSFARIKSYI